MTKIEELRLEITAREYSLASFRLALAQELVKPENNIFTSMRSAADHLYDALQNLAEEDCEGSHSCGQEKYEQQFIVDSDKYTAVLDVEYNRHDKKYYYIENTKFTVLNANGTKVEY